MNELLPEHFDRFYYLRFRTAACPIVAGPTGSPVALNIVDTAVDTQAVFGFVERYDTHAPRGFDDRSCSNSDLERYSC